MSADGNEVVRKKQPPIQHSLGLTLKEIYFGGVKKMKIHRLVFVNDEKTITEIREKILAIPIKPGIRPNTEIIFIEEGDENPAYIPGKYFPFTNLETTAINKLKTEMFFFSYISVNIGPISIENILQKFHIGCIFLRTKISALEY